VKIKTLAAPVFLNGKMTFERVNQRFLNYKAKIAENIFESFSKASGAHVYEHK
jgi:hypothetical protein